MTITFKPDALGRPTMPKGIGETLDYTFDFAAWLAKVGTTIASHTITVDDISGVVVESSANNSTLVTVWLSGGTVRRLAQVTCRIVTASSPARIAKKSIYLDLTDG